MGSQRSRGKKGSDIGLHMECYEDELSPAQIAAYSKAKSDFAEFTAKIESLVKNNNVDVVEKNDGLIVLQVKSNAAGPPPLTGLSVNTTAPQVPPGPTPISLSAAAILPAGPAPIALQSAQPQPPSIVAHPSGPVAQGSAYQLVMDQRGFIVGTVAPQSSTSLSVPVMAGPVMQPTTTLTLQQPHPTLAQTTTAPSNKVSVLRATPRPPLSSSQINAVSGSSGGVSNFRVTSKSVPITPVSARNGPSGSKAPESASAGSNNSNRSKAKSNTTSASSTPIVDLTDDDCKSSSGDNKEVTFNKLSGKTYPSLVVVARPNLKLREMSQSVITQERTYLDAKVKGVLMYTPTKFTEWLIQQGLVRSEQYCAVHVNSENTPVKLKLGMYSDISKFPYSGGYVWISDCCPQKFVSVFSGSIFEGAPHAPTVLLKLMYHWACQTNVQNIIQWVKVENPNIKNFYTTMRAVCTAAVHEKYDKLGGPKKRVEVGVISLGTTSQDGNIRKVKVEVLGLMEPDTKLIRLHAVEPVQDGEHQYKRRFARILAPLERWVHKESVILTDMTVDKGTLQQMGYQKVYQVAANNDNLKMREYTNSNIMEYLRKIVPRMFQNTLSLLSRQIIQQFLDELVWRERWGPVASQAFDTLITHIADQTKLHTGDTLVARLSKVAANPFKDWSYANWKTNCTPSSAATTPSVIKRQLIDPSVAIPDVIINPAPTTVRKRQASSPPNATNEPEAKRVANSPVSSSSPANEELAALEPYYYGTLPGNEETLKNQKCGPLNMKCVVCNVEVRDNLAMMKHLIGHASSDDSFSTGDSAPQCRYCLQNFATDTAVQSHVEEVHLKTSSLTCLICEEKFRSRMNLIYHMHAVHEELELPYVCAICKFRTSQHFILIDHFYEVHNESERGQCPFCLKIIMFESNNRRVTQNLYLYLNHIQRHQMKTVSRKCSKCKLSFVNKDAFREHQKDHISCKDIPDVKRYPNAGLDTMMMPKPPVKTTTVGPKGHITKQVKAPVVSSNKDFIISSFESLQMSGVDDDSLCVECKGAFNSNEHFLGYHYCLNCRFATCCGKAMAQHKSTFHDNKNTPATFDVSKPIMLEKPLHCVCGFTSASGNKLAKHLAVCHRKSAYPSAERAAQCTLQSQSASFPPLVTLDEPETDDKLLRAYIQHNESQESTKKETKLAVGNGVDPPSMLNILGLVRKPSTEDSNQDKTSSNDDTGNADASAGAQSPAENESKKEVTADKVQEQESDVKEKDEEECQKTEEVTNQSKAETVNNEDAVQDEMLAVDSDSSNHTRDQSSPKIKNEESVGENMVVDSDSSNNMNDPPSLKELNSESVKMHCDENGEASTKMAVDPEPMVVE